METELIQSAIVASAEAVRSLLPQAAAIGRAGDAIVAALQAGGKVLTAGNGGSAAEAMHMAEELVGRFRTNRRSLPGVALTADGTALTCIANDFGFDAVFSRQVEGLGVAGDVLVLFSTSGNAVNLRLALEAARRQRLLTVAFLGRDGGPLRDLADHQVIVPGEATERIQEVHQVLLHIMLDIVERAFTR